MNKSSIANKLSDVKVNYITKNIHGNNILDTGAGYCYYSEWLNKKYPNLTITSIDQLDLTNVDGISFIRSDLENPIPLPDNKFNTVLAFDIIEHINNEDGLIKELYRVCAEQGILIGSVPHDDDKFLPTYNLTFYHRSDLTHKRYYTYKTLKDALERNGFNVSAIDLCGGVSPQVIAEFFPQKTHFLIKKTIGLLRRTGIIKTNVLASDLFFIAKKK